MRKFQLWFVNAFPDYNAYNTTNAISNPRTAWKSDRATKIIVTLVFHNWFEKRKIPIEAAYTFFWDLTFFVPY